MPKRVDAKVLLLALAGSLIATGCGSGGEGQSTPTPAVPASRFDVTGDVTGLVGSGLTLRAADVSQVVMNNGPVTLPVQLLDGASYQVVVQTAPAGPSQSCSVSNGTGKVSAQAASVKFAVACVTNSYPVSGTVSGSPSPVRLRNSVPGGVVSELTAAGAFSFPAQLSGSSYAVSLVNQPSGATCTVLNPTGTVGSSGPVNVSVVCAAAAAPVGGSVTGLAGSGLTLQVNGVGSIPVLSNGAFSFAESLPVGAPYAVTVLTQPLAPSQVCVASNASGTVPAAGVTSVVITCGTSTYTVGGTVSNLLGSGLVLRNNGASDLPVSGASFSFPAASSGSAYDVTVVHQPASPSQTCGVINGAGNLGSSNVANLLVSCVNDDQVAPTVSSTLPADTTVGTDIVPTVVVRFSEELKASSATVSSFQLLGPQGPVSGTVALRSGNREVTFTPTSSLAFDAVYTATLTTAIEDLSGNPLATQFSWRFETGRRLAVGGYHTCVRLIGADAGKIKCWGSNQYGQLGKGSTVAVGNGAGGSMGVAIAPVDLGSGRVVQLEAGGNHTCARLNDGSVKCWGRNSDGQLGLGDTANRGDNSNEMGASLPAINLGSQAVVEIATGTIHSCARFDDGTVKCWGSNDHGLIGQGTSYGAHPRYNSPMSVPLGNGLRATRLTAGGYHMCAQLSTSSGAPVGLKCWGENTFGQLGQGDALARGDNLHPMGDGVNPINVGAGRSVRQAATSSGHTCALLDDSSVKCWGNNWFGQIATGTSNSAVDCSQADACIGDAPGEIGNALPTMNLGTGLTAAEVTNGARQTCVRFTDGRIKCWGWNAFGQLGLGDTATRGDGLGEMGDDLPFVNLGTGYNAAEVAAGIFHQCAVLGDGAVKCWGNNGTQSPQSGQGGQLGQGDTINRGDGIGPMGDALVPVDFGN